jgi:hypothetical protein
MVYLLYKHIKHSMNSNRTTNYETDDIEMNNFVRRIYNEESEVWILHIYLFNDILKKITIKYYTVSCEYHIYVVRGTKPPSILYLGK